MIAGEALFFFAMAVEIITACCSGDNAEATTAVTGWAKGSVGGFFFAAAWLDTEITGAGDTFSCFMNAELLEGSL